MTSSKRSLGASSVMSAKAFKLGSEWVVSRWISMGECPSTSFAETQLCPWSYPQFSIVINAACYHSHASNNSSCLAGRKMSSMAPDFEAPWISWWNGCKKRHARIKQWNARIEIIFFCNVNPQRRGFFLLLWGNVGKAVVATLTIIEMMIIGQNKW